MSRLIGRSGQLPFAFVKPVFDPAGLLGGRTAKGEVKRLFAWSLS